MYPNSVNPVSRALAWPGAVAGSVYASNTVYVQISKVAVGAVLFCLYCSTVTA